MIRRKKLDTFIKHLPERLTDKVCGCYLRYLVAKKDKIIDLYEDNKNKLERLVEEVKTSGILSRI